MGWENMTLEDMYRVYENKKNWHGTDNKAYRDVYNMSNNSIRSMYGMTEKDDISMGELGTYIAAAEKQLARDNMKNNLLTNLTNHANNGNAQLQKSADALRNFSYDPSGDEAYKSYVDMYNRQGQSAAKQTMNNLASTNMGRNSSYGAAAAAQVQQAYAQKASEMIPELAQQAYNRLLQQYNADRDMANDSYNRQLQAYKMLLDAESNEGDVAYQKAKTEGQKIDNKYAPQVYEDNHYNTVAKTENTWSDTEVNKQTAGKLSIQNEYLPEQLRLDLESDRLRNIEQVLVNESKSINNRIDEVTAMIAERYGMKEEEAKLIAQQLANQYKRKEIEYMY